MGNKQSSEHYNTIFEEIVTEKISEKLYQIVNENDMGTGSTQKISITGWKCPESCEKCKISGLTQFSSMSVNLTALAETFTEDTFEATISSAVDMTLDSSKDLQQGLSIASKQSGSTYQDVKRQYKNKIISKDVWKTFNKNVSTMSASQEVNLKDIEVCDISNIGQYAQLDVISSNLAKILAVNLDKVNNTFDTTMDTTAKDKFKNDMFGGLIQKIIAIGLIVVGLIMIGFGLRLKMTQGAALDAVREELRDQKIPLLRVPATSMGPWVLIIGGSLMLLIGLGLLTASFVGVRGPGRTGVRSYLGAAKDGMEFSKQLVASIKEGDSYSTFKNKFPNVGKTCYESLKNLKRRGILNWATAAASWSCRSQEPLLPIIMNSRR